MENNIEFHYIYKTILKSQKLYKFNVIIEKFTLRNGTSF